jgi:hypothetical protein
MSLFNLIKAIYVISKCIGNAQNDGNHIIQQRQMHVFPLKRSIANYIFKLQIHHKFEHFTH